MCRNLRRPPNGGLEVGHEAKQLKPKEEAMKGGRGGNGMSQLGTW